MRMESPGALLRKSARELQKTRALVYCALLLAIEVVLNAFVSVNVSQSMRISFGHLAVAAMGALYGPVPALLCSAAGDVIVFLIKPIGPYFPGFTLSAALVGLVYGMAFYRRKVRLVHILVAKAAVDILVYLLLNSLWLKLLYGSAFYAGLLPRFIKVAMQFPIDVLMLTPVLLTARRAAGRVSQI